MKDKSIRLAHGGGGRLTKQIEELFSQKLHNSILAEKGDAAVLDIDLQPGEKLAYSTDTFVVDPLFFPGGDIAHLAVCGTVNDLASMGAVPKYLSLGVIIEEGFGIDQLERIAESIGKACAEAGVAIVTGDTKVVGRGHGSGIYINTSGIGVIPAGRKLGHMEIQPGDAVIITGGIAEHGMAVMQARESLPFLVEIQSDAAPLAGMIESLFANGLPVHAVRDATRGGLAAVLNEMVQKKDYDILLAEESIPVEPHVKSACDMLGLDPLEVANEGKMVIFCPQEAANEVLKLLQGNKYGQTAAIIGSVQPGGSGRVLLKTLSGGKRIVEMPLGEQLPRIC